MHLSSKPDFKSNRALLGIALFALLAMSFAQEVSFEGEQRKLSENGIWIRSQSTTSPESLARALAFASLSGFTKVFLQVRTRGDAFYNSTIVPKNQNVVENFDPLAYAVDLGHDLGLEIHAWMNIYILWSSPSPPEQENHLYYTSPQWTEANLYNKMDWAIDLSQKQSPEWEGVFLSPMHPEVNPYLASVVREVVENYQIDGIHLDYMRFQDDFYGYNPAGREVFKSKHGIDPIDIVRGVISTRFGWSQEHVDSLQNLLKSTKRDQVTNLLKRIRIDLEELNSGVELSVAVKANPEQARKRWSQDWLSWVDQSIIDTAVPMNYFKNISDFNRVIQAVTTHFREEDYQRIMMGVSCYNQEASSVTDKIITARMNGIYNICLYSYDSHAKELDWFDPVLEVMNLDY